MAALVEIRGPLGRVEPDARGDVVLGRTQQLQIQDKGLSRRQAVVGQSGRITNEGRAGRVRVVLADGGGERVLGAGDVAQLSPGDRVFLREHEFTVEPHVRAAPEPASPPAAKRARVDLAQMGTAASASGAANQNAALTEILQELGEVERVKGDRIRANAYLKAAKALKVHPTAVTSGAEARALDGVGAKIAKKIDEILATGRLRKLDALKTDDRVVAQTALLKVHGIGPKFAAQLIDDHGVRSLADLRANQHLLTETQRRSLAVAEELEERIPRAEVAELEAVVQRAVAAVDPALSAVVCGSYRRGAATAGDMDVLLTHPQFTEATKGTARHFLAEVVRRLHADGFVSFDLAHGPSKYMGVVKLPSPGALHRRLDIRLIPHESFHYATLYFTGSATLNIEMRNKAIALGLVLSEYSLSRQVDPTSKAEARSEQEIFAHLGMEYLAPTERNW